MERFGPFIALFSLPLVVAASVEGFVLHYRSFQGYNWRGFGCSLVDSLTRTWLIDSLLKFNLAGFALLWAEKHQLWHLSVDSVSAFFLILFAEEFCYYWYHRCSHRVRWLWASHKPHHTANEMNLGNAYRFGWTAVWTGSRFFYIPAVLLGFPTQAVFSVLALNLFYQFWIHNEWMPKLGWLEYVFNTPSHHRVHHAANVEYLDANYGGIFIVFDRLFGTFIEERSDVPCRYGLVHRLESNNPFVTSFHEWWHLAKDLRNAGSFGTAVRFMIGPPGWRPGADSHTTEDLRRRIQIPVTGAVET